MTSRELTVAFSWAGLSRRVPRHPLTFRSSSTGSRNCACCCLGETVRRRIGGADLIPRTQRLLGGGRVLAILLAARVGMMRGGDEHDRLPHTIGIHLLQRVGQQRMPVAHADVDRQRTAGGNKAFGPTLVNTKSARTRQVQRRLDSFGIRN